MIKTAPKKKIFTIDAPAIKAAANIYKVFLNEFRREILICIHNAGFIRVKELYQQLEVEQSVASLHLRMLREAKVVHFIRKQRSSYYYINYQNIDHYTRLAETIAPIHRYSADKQLQAESLLVVRRKRKVEFSKLVDSTKSEEGITLTQNEIKIIQLICEQKQNSEIAEALDYSVRTVEVSRANILKKIGAKNMAGIVIYAIKNNLYKI